jgi:hypothetical protein
MPLTNGEYVLFALLTLLMGPCLAFFFTFFWSIGLLGPLHRLLGSDWPERRDAILCALFLWPLTLAPVHFLNFRVLGWPGWACLLLMFASFLLVACAVLLTRSLR